MKLEEGLSALGLELRPDALARLRAYHDLLRTRAVDIGAIARGDRDRIMERHVLDSLRGAVLISPEDRIAYDFGSGAGLPGIPLAIARPDCTFALIESRHWRAAFLELVASELELNVRVERARVESLGVQADLITARAFAPLERTWSLASSLLKPNGRLIFYAGRGMEDPEGAARGIAGDVTVRLEPDVLERGGPLVIIGGG